MAIMITSIVNFRTILLALFVYGIAFTCVATDLKQSSLLKQAISMRKEGDYHQAVNILVQLREKHSEHKRVNIELVLNYIKLHQYDSAEQIIQYLQVLTLTKREQKTLNKLTKLLEKRIRKPLSAHSFTVDIGAAAGVDIVSNRFPVIVYDDYQNYDDYIFEDEIVDDSTIDLDYDTADYADFDDYWYREDVTEKSQVNYNRQFVTASYRYRPERQFTLFTHSTQWIIDTQFSLDYRRFSQATNRRLINYQWDSSLYLLQINRWLLEVNAQASAHDNDYRRILNQQSGRIALTLPFREVKVKFSVEQQRKSYHAQLSDFDANITTPSTEISYQLTPKIRLSSGVKFRDFTAKDPYNSYKNSDVFLGIHYFPLVSLSAYAIYHQHRLHYKIDDPAEVNWSHEKKRSLAVGIRYQVNQSLSLSVNGNIGNKTIELGYGEDDWRRIETRLTYRF